MQAGRSSAGLGGKEPRGTRRAADSQQAAGLHRSARRPMRRSEPPACPTRDRAAVRWPGGEPIRWCQRSRSCRLAFASQPVPSAWQVPQRTARRPFFSVCHRGSPPSPRQSDHHHFCGFAAPCCALCRDAVGLRRAVDIHAHAGTLRHIYPTRIVTELSGRSMPNHGIHAYCCGCLHQV